MGFVTLEDVQGSIELVVFPRSWQTYSPLLQPDQIVLIAGKVDSRGSEPKVLVDTVSTEFQVIVSTDDPPDENMTTGLQDLIPVGSLGDPEPEPDAVHKTDDRLGLKNQPDAFPLDVPDPDQPPPPDAFPPHWDDNDEQPPASLTGHQAERSEAPAADPEATLTVSDQEEASEMDSVASSHLEIEAEGAAQETEPNARLQIDSETDTALKSVKETEEPTPTPVVSVGGAPDAVATDPVDQLAGESEEPPQMITVYLRASGDQTRDILRIRRIHGILISYPGNDRFAFYVVESGRGYVLEFPNFTTGVCDDLLNRLKDLLGVENVRAEPITFQ